MKILVACEESQAVTIELRKLGHEAYSCDIEPCSGGHPEWHIQQDVRPIINGHMSYCRYDVYKAPFPIFRTQGGSYHGLPRRWDMIIAFPPCTYMANSGSVRMRVNGEINKDRYEKAMKAKAFFMSFLYADCERICIENPTPMKLIGLPKCSQVIQPWMFVDPHTGKPHPYTKRTCLWLKGLPPLIPDIYQKPEGVTPFVNGGCKDANGNYRRFQGRKERDPKTRAKTFPGVARAMAEQFAGKRTEEDKQWND